MIYILLLLSILFSFKVEASVLSDAAASLQPGNWTTLTTTSANVWLTDNGNITEYAHKAAWDSVNKKVVFCGGSHQNSVYYNKCVYYTDSNNTWISFALPPGISYDGDQNGYISIVHGYDNSVIDPVRSVYYLWQDNSRLFRYDITNNQWLSTITTEPDLGCGQMGPEQAMFFPEIDRFIYFVTFGPSTCNVAFYLNPANNTWEYNNSQNFGAYAYSGESTYSSQGFVIAGSNNSSWWMLRTADYHPGSTTTWTQIASAPVTAFNGGQGVTQDQTALTTDPASGRPLLLSLATGLMYEYNPNANTWTSKGAGSASIYAAASGYAVLVPIPEYNVIMMIVAQGVNSVTVYLYKNYSVDYGDFLKRADQPGVFMSIPFNQDSDLGAIHHTPTEGYFQYWRGVYHNGYDNTCNTIVGGDECPTIDQNAPGGSAAMKLFVPSGGMDSGQFYTNFSTYDEGYFRRFGENEQFYISWRERFDANYIANMMGNTAAKQAVIGLGSTLSAGASSCTYIDEVVQNNHALGGPQMYHHCAMYEEFATTQDGDTDFQNMRPSPYCLRGQWLVGQQFPPTGNCYPYYVDDWMVFKVGTVVGTLTLADGTIYTCHDFTSYTPYPAGSYCFKDSHVTLSVARENETSWTPILDVYIDLGYLALSTDKYGTIWFTMYVTQPQQPPYPVYNGDSTTWVKHLILSTQDIGLPAPMMGGAINTSINLGSNKALNFGSNKTFSIGN